MVMTEHTTEEIGRGRRVDVDAAPDHEYCPPRLGRGSCAAGRGDRLALVAVVPVRPVVMGARSTAGLA